jgi:hypothetical protein
MEGSSESESSSGSDTYADMPALEPMQIRRELPQARWNDDDDNSDDDSDSSIPSLEFRDDSSLDDSSVGGASISSHESVDPVLDETEVENELASLKGSSPFTSFPSISK